MTIQDTIGCLAQIKRGKSSIDAAFESKEPIWLLFFETDEPSAEVATLTYPSVGMQFAPLLHAAHQGMRKGLLTVLHCSGLHRDDPRCLGRFRDGYDLYRSLSPRLEKLNTVQLVVSSPTRESVISVRKYALEPQGPLADIKLPVSSKSVSGSSGTMPRDKGFSEDRAEIWDLGDPSDRTLRAMIAHNKIQERIPSLLRDLGIKRTLVKRELPLPGIGF